MNVNKTIEAKASRGWSANDISDHLWHGGVSMGSVAIYNSSAWKRGRANRATVGERAPTPTLTALGMAVSQVSHALGVLSPYQRRIVLKLVA